MHNVVKYVNCLVNLLRLWHRNGCASLSMCIDGGSSTAVGLMSAICGVLAAASCTALSEAMEDQPLVRVGAESVEDEPSRG